LAGGPLLSHHIAWEGRWGGGHGLGDLPRAGPPGLGRPAAEGPSAAGTGSTMDPLILVPCAVALPKCRAFERERRVILILRASHFFNPPPTGWRCEGRPTPSSRKHNPPGGAHLPTPHKSD